MQNLRFSVMLMLLFAVVMFQGFQCSSPDFQGAKVYEQNKNYVEAVKSYERELQKNPANEEAWFRLGKIRGEQLKDYEGMMAAFREAEKLSPKYKDQIHVYRYQAWAQHINDGYGYKKRASADSMQFYDKAIEEYKISAGIWPDTSLTYDYLSEVYEKKGDIDNVIACQKKVWELDHNVEAYKRVGMFLVQEALKKKEEFKSINSDKLKVLSNLKEIDKGSYKSDVMRAFGAPDSQKKDKKNPKREDWRYDKYGMTLSIESDKVVGKKIDKKIDLKIDSTKYKEAVVQLNSAVNVFEEIKSVNPRDNENLNLLLQAYYEADRIKEATATFKQAVANDPGNKMNHYILGLLYRTLDDYDGAIKEINEAVKIDPEFSDAFYELGATYFNWGVKLKKEAQEKGDESKEFKKKFESALPWMQKVSQMKSDDAKIWQTLGTIYIQLGQNKDAEKAFNEADKLRKASK